MKGLGNLIRLHKQKLDERRQKLAQLQSVAAGFTNQIATLEREASREAEKAGESPESVHAIGAFVQATLARRDALTKSLTDVQAEIEALQAEITEGFSEVKRYEVVQERRETQALHARRRRDRKAEDAIGISIYQRRGSAAGV